ncbi:MAG: hypothetical protein HC869_04975 [Rhodospirillales bacterium]|nr:hypothetical protein [Rhodospirillales bacterium]
MLRALPLPYYFGALTLKLLALALRGFDALPMRPFRRFLFGRNNPTAPGEHGLAIVEADVGVGQRRITGSHIAAVTGVPLRDELLIQAFELSTLLALKVALLLAVDFLLGALQEEIENLLSALRSGREGECQYECKPKQKQAQHGVPPHDDRRAPRVVFRVKINARICVNLGALGRELNYTDRK